MDQCRRTLEQHNWNIEVRTAAIAVFFLNRFQEMSQGTELEVTMGEGVVFQAAVQDRLNEQEGVPSVFNPPPSRPLQVNTADHRVYSYIVSRPQPRVSTLPFSALSGHILAKWLFIHWKVEGLPSLFFFRAC